MKIISEDLKKIVIENYNHWVKLPKEKRPKFNASYLLKNNKLKAKYENSLRKKSGFWSLLLTEVCINPDIYVVKKLPREKLKSVLIEALKEIKEDLGIENLNDHSMNRINHSIPLPKSLCNFKGKFKLSDSHGEKPTINTSSFQMRCIRAFGTWDKALEAAGFNIRSIKRKISKHSVEDILSKFDRFIENNKNWSPLSLKQDESALYKAIDNHSKINKSEILPYAHISHEFIFSMWVFWRSWKENDSTEFLEKWWIKNKSKLIDEYENNHRKQERWSLKKLQRKVLRLYSEGSDLSRQDISNRDETSFLASCRRYSHSGGEQEVFKKSGILTENVRNLSSILDDIPLAEVVQRLKKRLAKSLDKNMNLMSRESIQKEDQETFNAALRWFNRLNPGEKILNDWSMTLEFFGFNPNVFEITSSKRVRRGYVFQRFFYNLIRPYFNLVTAPEEVIDDQHFCYNKSYRNSSCTHSIKCKPDFVFKKCIIDTKVGGSLANSGQIERYLEHKDLVYVLTLNDKEKVKKSKNGTLKIISISSFIYESKSILGVMLPIESIDELNLALQQETLFTT